MCVILTNDDGVNARGIHTLRELVRELNPLLPCVIVAPNVEKSACAHQLTFSRPINVQRLKDDVLAVDGTPADCVRLSVATLGLDNISLVLSGINHGSNLGVDLFVSGTASAAREAALLGLPAMAISHYFAATATDEFFSNKEKDERNKFDWLLAKKNLHRIFAWLAEEKKFDPLFLRKKHCNYDSEKLRDWQDKLANVQSGKRFRIRGKGDRQVYWNVNLPISAAVSSPKIVECPPSLKPFDICYEKQAEASNWLDVSDYHWREVEAGADVEVCARDENIAVSEIQITPC